MVDSMIVIGALALLVGGITSLVMYNRLIRERNEVHEAWHTVEVELTRRFQLVPQLVAAVQAAAAHEQRLLVWLTQQNQQAAAQGFAPPAVSHWNPQLVSAIHQVVALREKYPQLNSQQNYLRLQHQLAITEDRIAAARRFYNLQVRQLNDRIGIFPSNLVARVANIRAADHFADSADRTPRT